jgi:fatty-acyl-CoA synthase
MFTRATCPPPAAPTLTHSAGGDRRHWAGFATNVRELVCQSSNGTAPGQPTSVGLRSSRAARRDAHRVKESSLLHGLMQTSPLTVNAILGQAERLFSGRSVVSYTHRGTDEHRSFGEVVSQARRIAGQLDAWHVPQSARVGTFCWNNAAHLAAFFGIPCSGRVIHTINVRASDEQIAEMINHAADEVVFVDASLVPDLLRVIGYLETVRKFVVFDDGYELDLPHDSRFMRWDSLDPHPAELSDVVRDENAAAALCYTSGTSGAPKGVLYSHRSTWLHAMMHQLPNSYHIQDGDIVMPVVPMFHANASGLPYSSFWAGADLVLPGHDMSADNLTRMIQQYLVTVTAAVPTVWTRVGDLLDQRDLTSLRLITSGGSPLPAALIERYREKIGIPITQVWGMTEISPLGTFGKIRSEYRNAPADVIKNLAATAGMPVSTVELRIVDSETHAELPWDGVAAGELQVCGPTTASAYYLRENSPDAFTDDGWLRTGDVATVSPHGYLSIVDRTKDLIKSGGEWISAAEVEAVLAEHPAISQAAVIAVSHPKWMERPFGCVVLRGPASATPEELQEFVTERMEKWQVPDGIAILDELPLTSVGKVDKRVLRDQFKNALT